MAAASAGRSTRDFAPPLRVPATFRCAPGIWISKFPASAYASPSNRSIERSRFNSGSNNMTAMRPTTPAETNTKRHVGNFQTAFLPSLDCRLLPETLRRAASWLCPCGELVVRLANSRSLSDDQVSVKSSAAILRIGPQWSQPEACSSTWRAVTGSAMPAATFLNSSLSGHDGPGSALERDLIL